MEDPDSYLGKSDPPKPATMAAAHTVPWHAHERFLEFLCLAENGSLEAYTHAGNAVQQIFLCLLSGGCDPFSASELFIEGYCAAHGFWLIAPKPEDEQDITPTTAPDCHDEDPGECSVTTCPRVECSKHPQHEPTPFPDDAGERELC
jgi:hypothetical protein